jgi:hypothetical protein
VPVLFKPVPAELLLQALRDLAATPAATRGA